MNFELPHKKDFATNAKLPGYLTENAAAIEQAINDLQKQIDNEVQARQSTDEKLSGRINELNNSVNDLKDLVKELDSNVNDHEQRLKKIEKLLFGFERVTVTDPSDDIKASQQAVEISNMDDTDDDSVSVVTID